MKNSKEKISAIILSIVSVALMFVSNIVNAISMEKGAPKLCCMPTLEEQAYASDVVAPYYESVQEKGSIIMLTLSVILLVATFVLTFCSIRKNPKNIKYYTLPLLSSVALPVISIMWVISDKIAIYEPVLEKTSSPVYTALLLVPFCVISCITFLILRDKKTKQ